MDSRSNESLLKENAFLIIEHNKHKERLEALCFKSDRMHVENNERNKELETELTNLNRSHNKLKKMRSNFLSFNLYIFEKNGSKKKQNINLY